MNFCISDDTKFGKKIRNNPYASPKINPKKLVKRIS